MPKYRVEKKVEIEFESEVTVIHNVGDVKEEVVKCHALFSNSVKMRRLGKRMSRAAQTVVPQIVSQNKNDIRTAVSPLWGLASGSHRRHASGGT